MRLLPRIGVTGPATGGWVPRELTARALRRAGAEPVQLTPHDPVAGLRLDGLVLSGGADVDPRRYGGERDQERPLDLARDAFELDLVRFAEDRQLPLLGICRGAQLWNVALGGSLHADVTARRGRNGRRRRLRPSWHVSVAPGSRLAEALGDEALRVNRLHSQAIAEVGEGLVAVAWDRYEIVQAVERPGRPFRVGVQWHPELLPGSVVQRRLWRELVESARLHRTNQQTGGVAAGTPLLH